MTKSATITGLTIVLAWLPLSAAQSVSKAPAASATVTNLSSGEIEKLVAPIALYPDVLISQILPASTFPTEIVTAARWCKEHADLKGLDDQPWDLSVISICRYPQILDQMNKDLDWTNALGATFLGQPSDVMAAIQQLRQLAKDAGVLKTTPQQVVVEEKNIIQIAPAEKEVIYVPQYNPQVIFVDDDDDDDYDGSVVASTAGAAAIGFGVGLAMGAWLDNDCDWYHGGVVACRPGYWGGYGYRGAVVRWDNDWVAARGPRRGVVAGEHGGAYVGPNGAAVWGENGRGAAWGRSGGYGAPAYGGRYSGYNNVSGNRRNVVAGNTVNVNRTNVNIDRGDSTNVQGGNRTKVGGGDRTNVSGGNRTNVAGGDRTNVAGGDRTNPGGNTPSNAGSGAGANRPSGGARTDAKPAAQPKTQRPAGSSSSMNDRRSSSEVSRSSSRGSSSRGGGGGSRGGGGRR